MRSPRVHRQHPIHQPGHAFHVVIDQQDGAAVPAEAVDQVGEDSDFRRRQPGEGFIDQHHLRVARQRLGHLQPAQIGERQRRRAPVQHGTKAHAFGDRPRAFLHMRRHRQLEQRVGQERELDVLQHRLSVERAGVLEHDPQQDDE